MNLQLAKKCVELSARAYRECTISAGRSTQAVIATGNGEWAMGNRKVQFVAFRGSQELADFVTDGEAWMTKQAGCGIHHGFEEAYHGIERGLIEALDPELPVVFTGHSLGGALAVLAAMHFQYSHEVAAVYTFGQPRVGDAMFARLYNETVTTGDRNVPAPSLGGRTFRFVLEEDIVPRLPGVLLGYRHAGQEVFLPASTKLGNWEWAMGNGAESPGYILNPSLLTKIFSDIRGLWNEWRRRGVRGAAAILQEHGVGRYLERVSGLIAKDPSSKFKAQRGRILTAENAENAEGNVQLSTSNVQHPKGDGIQREGEEA